MAFVNTGHCYVGVGDQKVSRELAARSQFDLVDGAKIDALCNRHRKSLALAKRVEAVEDREAEIEALLAAIKKWKPEYSPQVNSLWLFARKRIGELTPKETGGPGNNASRNNDALSAAQRNRRWQNASLAEFWDHEELNPRLESGTISLTKAIDFIKLERARRKAKKYKGKTPINEVIYAPFQSIMAGIPDESIELIFADPPWDSASISMYSDIGREAPRILVPGGSMLVYSSSQMLNRTIAMLHSEGMRYYGLCYDVRCSGKYARLNRSGIIVRAMPLIWYAKGADRFGTADFVEDAVVTDTKQKGTHDWQQHEAVAAYYIDKLTSKKGIVFDPFCGGGTTAAIAKSMGRRFITCDIDENAVEAAKERLNA